MSLRRERPGVFDPFRNTSHTGRAQRRSSSASSSERSVTALNVAAPSFVPRCTPVSPGKLSPTAPSFHPSDKVRWDGGFPFTGRTPHAGHPRYDRIFLLELKTRCTDLPSALAKVAEDPALRTILKRSALRKIRPSNEPPSYTPRFNIVDQKNKPVVYVATLQSDTSSVPSSPPPFQANDGSQGLVKEQISALFQSRDVTAAQTSFQRLNPSCHSLLIGSLIHHVLSSDEESEDLDADAILVSNLFALASAKGSCSPESFEEGFSVVAKRFARLMGLMIKGPAFKESDSIQVMCDSNGLAYKLRI